MKTFIVLVTSFIVLQTKIYAQENLITSKSVVGFWRQVVPVQKNEDGTIKKAKTSNYKIFNTDGTIFTFTTWFNQGVVRKNATELEYDVTDIGFFGNYKITSDSTLTETIVRHALKPNQAPYDSNLKFKLLSPNELAVAWNNNGVWIPELWERIVLAEIPDAEKKRNLSGKF